MLEKIKQDYISHRNYYGVSGLKLFKFSSPKIMLSFRIRTAFKQKGIPLINPLMARIERIVWGIEISSKAKLGSVIFLHSIGVVIGANSVIGDGTVFSGSNTIGTRYQAGKSASTPIIGKNVQIGCGARILGSITIGDNVEIGANAVVIRSVPSDSIALGVPAHIKPKKNNKS